MTESEERRPRLVTLGGHETGLCPVCGWDYAIAYGPDRVEQRLQCDCPAGAPDDVLANALLTSTGLEGFPAVLSLGSDVDLDIFPGGEIQGTVTFGDPPNSETE